MGAGKEEEETKKEKRGRRSGKRGASKGLLFR